MNRQVPVAIVGVSGYAGIELARIVSAHPGLRLVSAISDKWAGQLLGDVLALPDAAAGIRCIVQTEAPSAFAGVELVFLCTPPEVSIALAGPALQAGARVIDLSGGFRLPAGEYPRWYGFSHPSPGLLDEAVYSLPEATELGAALRTARLVSNPGATRPRACSPCCPCCGRG